jgi:DUF1365 family protein
VNSRLYTGRVAHHRVRPKKNAFSYAIYYLYVDLDELDDLDQNLRWFSHNSGNLTSLHDEDHMPLDGSPLRPWIDGVLDEAGIDLGGGRVCLLTFPRVLGTKFYPVSFWFCFHADGDVRAVLAEVQNTYRDHHNYLLHNHGETFDWDRPPTVEKVFYVSPFIDMDAVYEFHFTEPAETLKVTLNDIVEGSLLLVTSLDLHERELTDGALWKTVLRHGPISAVALIKIHWQAIFVIAKGAGIRKHPEPPEDKTTIEILD